MEKQPMDIESLSEVLRLVKGRDASAIQRSEGKEILRQTNALLKRGLLTNLLTTLKDDVNGFCKPDANSLAVAGEHANNQLQVMRLKADIVFFTAYQTQFEEAEANALLATTKYLSDLLLSAGAQTRDDGAEWCPPIYSLLVVLQLAHVAALQQTTSLLSRHVDYALPMYQQCRSIEDVIEVGNSLPQSPGSRCGMEYAGKGDSSDWLCDGAKGFACLAFAILRQPEVDIDHAPASDVEWFLHEACRLRAYSYIRLCVLPVLQAAYLQDRDTTLFYVAVLCELMENLAKIFCMTHYKQVHAHNENDFPYIFFPPTGEFYADNMAFYASRLGGASGQKLAPAPAVDSLEDVVSVYTALLELRPEFAHIFWPSTQSHDIEVQHRQHQQQMQQTSEHHDIVDHYYHPFVMKAVDASFHHPGLMIAAIRFVAALSNSPLGRTAYAGYLFVLDSSHHRFSWGHFFDSMDTIALQLGASLSTAVSGAGAGFGGTGYAGGLSSFGQSAQQQQQQQLVQHNFSLTEKDAEGLVAIMKLIGAVAVHPAVAALLHESFRPVPRLFALLSCALPITLKGAILKTLSVFARGSAAVSEEVWVLVEAHRLLPITTAQFGSTAGTAGQGQLFGARRASAQGRGLRTELEEAESRAGRYPVTEGFLQLLDALLSHGTPDSTLGQGYRRPGLMVYLDYVVEDVLLKCQDRSYQPADWPSARAQRWRITAHCLTVLCTLLRNYHVNAVPADTVQAAEEWLRCSEGNPAAALLKDVIADFRDQSAEYAMEGSAAPQRCSRPKSAAFMVMSLLLGRARLFDYLGYVLLECSPENLERSFNEHCVSEVGAAVDLLQKQYELAHPSTAAKVESSFDFSFPMAGVASAGARAAAQAPAQEIEPLDLTSLGRESHLCDLVFWQERSVAGAVGLVYECALREEKFMSLFRSTPGKLTITRVSEQGRVAVLPVIAHDLSELLCADRDNEMLALIAQVVPAHVRSCPCLPPVNVLSVRVLEHVALHLPAARLIAALIPSSQSQQAGFLGSLSADRGAGPSWFLMQGCAAALKAEATAVAHDSETLHYDVVCMGCVAYPQFFSLSAAYTRNITPPNLYLTMINADSVEEAAQVDAEVIRALRLGGTIREAVLSLLLHTLTPSSVCLSHQLLGLVPASVGSNTASKFLPEGCLDAALYLLSPASTPLGSTFLQQSPEQAVDCFELVYRLSASPVTSAAVLRRLGDRQVDFFRVQLSLVAYLLHLSDEELLEGADLEGGQRDANGSTGISSSFAALQAIKTAVSASCAWLLKTCTLYLRFSELHKSATTTAYAQSLLELLFSGCDSLPFEDGRGDRVSVLEKLLGCATSFPAHPSQAGRLSSGVQKALEASSTLLRLSKAGSGWGDSNPFLRQDAAHAAALSYQVVDLRVLALQLKRSVGVGNLAELQEALSAAVLVNIHDKAAAVATHLCMSWCQLVNIITATGRTLQSLAQLLGGRAQLPRITATDRFSRVEPRAPYMSADGAAASRLLEVVVEQLFRPTAAVLAAGIPGSSEQYRTLPEHFARCLLSQVKIQTAPLDSADSTFEGEAAFMLAPEQHTQLLENVVALLLQRPRDLSQDAASAARRSTAGDLTTSTAYRGLLAAALVRVLQAPSKFGNSFSESQDTLDAGWSQENKSQQDFAAAGTIDATALVVSECEAANMIVLAQRAGELVDALGRDCSQRGGGMWQLSSIGALTSVMATLQRDGSALSRAGDREGEQVFGSHAFLQALHVLVQRGHLQSLLALALEAPGSVAASDDREALLMSTLSLCKHIASCVEGAEALLACDAVQKLVSLEYFANPPPFPDEIAYFGVDVLQSREAAVEQLQSRYLAVISLLRCLFAAAPQSQPVAQGVGLFLTKNHVLVTQLLRMRYLSLGGLAMTEATVAVIAMLAAVPGAPLRQQESGDVLACTLGSSAASFQADICTLLGVIGRSPVPASLTDDSGSPRGESWWDHIQPSGGEDGASYEAEWARTQCSGVATEGMPADWSVFDDRKLRLSLQVLVHCSTFLRLASVPQRVAASPSGLRAINAVAAMEAFCRCAALSQALLVVATADAPVNSVLTTAASLVDARSWLQSPLVVQPGRAADTSTAQWEEGTRRREVADALLLAAENLVCAVHNCALAGADGGAATSLPTQQTQRVLEVAAAFPSHSFIRQVARWVKDLLLK